MTQHLCVSECAWGDSWAHGQWLVLARGQGGALPAMTETLLLSETFPRRETLRLAEGNVMLAVLLQG